MKPREAMYKRLGVPNKRKAFYGRRDRRIADHDTAPATETVDEFLKRGGTITVVQSVSAPIERIPMASPRRGENPGGPMTQDAWFCVLMFCIIAGAVLVTSDGPRR
jgi:hypothetical protein